MIGLGYVTLAGERIDLSALSREDQEFMEKAATASRSGESYPDFVNRVHAPGSPALAGGDWVTQEVLASPLYRVCADLADRLGVAQGFLALGENASGAVRAKSD